MNSYIIVGSLLSLLVSLYGVEGGSLLESVEETAEKVALSVGKSIPGSRFKRFLASLTED